MRVKHDDAGPKKKASKKRASKKKAGMKKHAKKKVDARKKPTVKPRPPARDGDEREKNSGVPLFTHERKEQIIRLLRMCYFIYEVAEMVGVSDSALDSWLRRGRTRQRQIEQWDAQRVDLLEQGSTFAEHVDLNGTCPEKDEWFEFKILCDEAQGKAKRKMVRVVRKDAQSTVATAQWWLERRYPKEFGRAAMRPGIGLNAGESHDTEAAGVSDPIAELDAEIAGIAERLRQTQALAEARASEMQKAEV